MGKLRPKKTARLVASILALAPFGGTASAATASPSPSVPIPANVPTVGKDGQLSTKFRINHDSPEDSVPSDIEKNNNPMEFGYFLQDLLAEAAHAEQRKDWGAMVRYYRAVAKAVPDQAKGWSKLCEAYKLANDPARGGRACRRAMERPGAVLDDFTRYVNLTLQKSEPLEPEEAADIRKALAHLESQPPETALTVTINQLRCQLAVKTSDTPLLEQCTAVLAMEASTDLKTVIYQWSLAVRKDQGRQAARFLRRAKDLGLPAGSIENMQRLTPAYSPGPPAWLWAAVALLLAGAGIAIARALRKRRAEIVPEHVSP